MGEFPQVLQAWFSDRDGGFAGVDERGRVAGRVVEVVLTQVLRPLGDAQVLNDQVVVAGRCDIGGDGGGESDDNSDPGDQPADLAPSCRSRSPGLM